MKGIYPPITEIEYEYMLKRGILFSVYAECTGSYKVDKELFEKTI